jgi:glycerol-3-phosphate dehydrogenase
MKYDLVVIGAGIQGAGVAQAAAAAGYSVLILEQSAPAAGTSSKSSKLIHGGLRYLETAQFGLVRESLQERALLLNVAPDLVKLQYLHIPIYKNSVRNALTIRAGLSLYACLSGLDKNALFAQLPQKKWGDLEGLEQRDLKAVFRYQEAQTDDAALTRAVLYSAINLGAELSMPALFVGARRDTCCCVVTYDIAGKQQTVSCRVLVNCGGPWARDILTRIHPPVSLPSVELVQGSHLLLPPLLKHYFYLESLQDKRAVFVLPWQGKLMIGTTEKLHTEKPEAAHCTAAEQEYLMATLQHYFPNLQVPAEHIESFAGLRVLPLDNKSAFARTREVLFAVDDEASPRVLSLMGGKLTTYRATAQIALNRIKNSLPAKDMRADTRQLMLTPVDESVFNTL